MKCKECHMEGPHKMDCSTGYREANPIPRGRPPVIKAPTILAVKDERHHMVSHTIVDYDQVDGIIKKIKELCERNHWHHEITVLPSERYFMSELTMMDVVKEVK